MVLKITKDYTTVSLPIQLYRQTKLIVQTSSQYTSVSEFVKEAIREKISRALDIEKDLRRMKL